MRTGTTRLNNPQQAPRRLTHVLAPPPHTQLTPHSPEEETLKALGTRLRDLCEANSSVASPAEFETFCRNATHQVEEERRHAEGACRLRLAHAPA